MYPDDYYHDDYAGPATMGDAHTEWHHNAGVPVGRGTCPWDACDPYAVDPDDFDTFDHDVDDEGQAVEARDVAPTTPVPAIDDNADTWDDDEPPF